MATQPEFITLLRVIRDTYYPDMGIWYEEVLSMYNSIILMQVDIRNMHEDVQNIWDGIITQTASGETVPSTTPASATYDAPTNNTHFLIPAGAQGESLDMDYTVLTLVERDALTVIDGDICYVDETLSLYIAMTAGTGAAIWGGAISFSPATDFVGLGDTPSDYTNDRGLLLRVRADELGVEFASPEEIGVEGFNHIYNPRIDDIWEGESELDNALFGTEREGYAGYDEKTGESLDASNIIFAGAGYANNLNVSANGQIAVGVQFGFAALGPTQTLFQIGDELNGFAIGTDGSSQLGVFARNAGVLTSIISGGMAFAINTEYFVACSEDMITVCDLVTGEVVADVGTLDVPNISYPRFAIGGIGGSFTGSIITGAAGAGAYFNGEINAMMVHDRTSYSESDTDMALGWKKEQAAGDFMVMPVPGDRAGTAVIQYDTTAADTILSAIIGTAEEFLYGDVTVSFNISNWSNIPVVVGIDYIIDTGNPNNPGGQLIRTAVSTPTIAAQSAGREAYTFTAPSNPGILLDGNKGYFEFNFATGIPFMMIIDKFKAENGLFDTGYTENHRGPDWVQMEDLFVSSVDDLGGNGTEKIAGIVSCSKSVFDSFTPDKSITYFVIG